MIKKYANLTPKEHVDRYYSARSQMSHVMRGYKGADETTVEVGPNIRLGITRSRDCGRAIIHISHFETPELAHYARFRLNDMAKSTESLDLVDQNYAYVDPNNVPLHLTPLAIQVELAFTALNFIREQHALTQ